MRSRRFSPAFAARRSGAPDPFIGRTLGECTIVACLARSRRCAVYQARHRVLNRDVAIKILSPDLSPDPHAVARFAHEAEMAGVAHHDGLIEVHGTGESNGLYYIIMRLVEGEELSSALFREGPLREATAVPLMRQVAVALATLHRARVLHCDVRPANILVTSDEQAVLIGMGQARRFDEPPLPRRGDDPADLPLYFPPEAAHGRQFDPRSDLYLFGATFYHVLSGSPPFEAASPEEWALLYLRGEPAPLQEEVPGTSPALCSLVHRLLKKDPEERPQNIGQLLDDLAPIETEAIGQAKAMARFRKTNRAGVVRRLARAAVLAGAVAALVLLGVLASTLISSPHPDPAPPDLLLEAQARPPKPAGGDPEPEPDREPPLLKVGPARTPWPAALARAGGEVARLVDEHRYGNALALYDALDDQYSELELRERTARMRAEVLRHARAAYAEVEARADELKDDGSFEEAQAVLRRAAERYGLPDVSRKAGERIAALDLAARAARERRENEEKAAAERAERDRRRRLRADFERAVGRAQRSLRVFDVADAQRRLAAFDPADPVVGADAARWHRDIAAVAALKRKTLDHVNRATPPLHSSTVGVAGAGGTLVRADDRGITMQLSRGGEETHAWEELGSGPILKLAWRARDANSRDDALACGILAAIAGAADEARDAYLRAEALGADVSARLAPIVQADIEEIAAQVQRGDFARAAASLKQFETTYRGSRSLAVQRTKLDAARAAIARGAGDAEAEKVYGEAAALFEQGRLFELKPLLARLKTEFPTSTAVRDTTRPVPFSRMAEAVKTLGVRIVVSQRFGDVRTLREAVERAEPYSLIEVAGGIPHIESVTVPARLRGLVIRGTGAVPPVLTAVGALERADDLLTVEAPNVTLERIVLAHGDPLRPLRGGAALVAKAGPLRLRDVVAAIALPSGIVQGRDGASLRAERDVALDAEACAFVGATLTAGPAKAVGCLWVHGPAIASGGSFEAANCLFLDGTRLDAPATLLRCTALGDVQLRRAPNQLRDCVLYGVRADALDTRIDYCHVYGRTGVAGEAKPGLNLSTGKVRFFLPHKLDFRVARSDRNPASDDGARGYRPNKTMDALRQQLLKLRAADRVHFALTHQRP